MNATLYRFFDADNNLLYVGQTTNWGSRFMAHAGDKPWWAQVVRVELQHFEDVEDAALAEARAILEESPRFNRLRRDPDASAARPRRLRRDEVYRLGFHCANCGTSGYELPKGTVLADHDCRWCEVAGTLRPGPRPRKEAA